MTDTPDAEQQVSRAKRLAAAFNSVFGQARGRSTDQRLVLDHLRFMACVDTAMFVGDKVGTFDPLAAAHRDGARVQFLIIERWLTKYVEQQEPKKVVRTKK